MADLSTKVTGIEFKSPLLLASGILGETAASMDRVMAEGAAGVVTKSIGTDPREGHGTPAYLDLEVGTINAMGLPNPGIDAYVKELADMKGGGPVMGSVFGKDAREYASLAVRMERAGCRAVELNLSCPHAEKTGLELGADTGKVGEITAAVCKAVGVPVWVKLSPTLPNMVEVARTARDAGAGAVVLTNTLKSMVISVEAKMPVLANGMGGMGGPALKPVALRCVWEVRRALGDSIDIVGVGGIGTGRDVAEYLMAGARAVQMGSAVAGSGPAVFRTVERELDVLLTRLGHGSVGELVGLAVPEVVK